VFIAGMAPEEQAHLERFKFEFHHQRRPVWNSLGSLSWRSPVPLDRYLSPPGDLFARVAQPFLQELKRERERAEKGERESDQ
jgi:hypothetical protein